MITPEDVERLMESDQPDATLVIVGGRPVVAAGAETAGSDGPEGFVVVSRADLVARAGERLSSAEGRELIAAELDAAVTHLGG